MTAEDLSSASAERHTDRVLHELQSTARLARPPRIEPPASARESLSDPVHDDAPPSPATPPPPAPVVSARMAVANAETKAHEMMRLFDDVENDLAHYLTPSERRRVRSASCALPVERAIVSHPLASFLTSALLAALLGMFAGACMRPSAPAGYRLPSRATRSNVDRLVGYA